jgi:hypothetical protein
MEKGKKDPENWDKVRAKEIFDMHILNAPIRAL